MASVVVTLDNEPTISARINLRVQILHNANSRIGLQRIDILEYYNTKYDTLQSTVHYSCRQTKSSNLLTDFLGIWKALKLVDNSKNEFLLISLLNGIEQNSQKWRYKGFRPQKFGQCLKK